ncbi:MAG: PD-(D/E)XK nuclease family transposase [Clostridiales bacterium]|nr:PD-(D/E)XK nuclease family transposase [Clostridiales bacterium]
MERKIAPERREKYLRLIQDMRIIDDVFMNAVFKDNKECTELVLRIILDRKDLIVTSVKTQESLKNIYGRSLALDILAQDSEGRIYDIEFQRDSSKASARRARYHSSLMDSNYVLPGDDFEELPEKYVIFVTEEDVFGEGLPLYSFSMACNETAVKFPDGTHIIYVNGENRSDTELGILMQDFFCTRADDIKNKILADKVRLLKEETEEERMMCETWDEFVANEVAEGKKEAEHEKAVEIATSLITKGIPVETIKECTGLKQEVIDELLKAAV